MNAVIASDFSVIEVWKDGKAVLGMRCPRHQGRLVWSHSSLFRCNTSTSFAFSRNELRYLIKNVFRYEGELSVAPQPKDRSTILMFL